MAGPPRVELEALRREHWGQGFPELLGQLTALGEVTEAMFVARLAEVDAAPGHHVVVAVDRARGRVVGAATLLEEGKFARGCGRCGHIEDVVVDAAARGQRIGQRLVDHLTAAAAASGCYKVILDCAEANVGFYEKCGFSRKEVQMAKYF